VEITPIVEKLVENKIRWFGHVERRPVDAVIRSVYQMEVGANLSRAGCGNSHTSSGPIFFIISPAHNSIFIFSIEKKIKHVFSFPSSFLCKTRLTTHTTSSPPQPVSEPSISSLLSHRPVNFEITILKLNSSERN
jgi:hypothetical protein